MPGLSALADEAELFSSGREREREREKERREREREKERREREERKRGERNKPGEERPSPSIDRTFVDPPNNVSTA